jgi:Fungal Zn(2)-Cys(6) binuclear cluster domain
MLHVHQAAGTTHPMLIYLRFFVSYHLLSFQIHSKACDFCVKEKRKCNSGNPCDQCEKRDRGDQCTYSERKKSGPRAHGGGTLMSSLPARPTSARQPATAAAAAKKAEVAAPRPKRPVRQSPAAAAAASAPQQRQLREKKKPPAAAAAAAALAPPQPAERTDTGSSWVSLDEDLSQLSEIDEKGRAKLAWLLESNHLGDSSNSGSSSSRGGSSRKRVHDTEQMQQQHHKRHKIDDDESDDDVNMRQQDMAPPFEPPTARRLAARGDIPPNSGSAASGGSSSATAAAKPIEKHDSVNVDFGSAAAASDAADEGLNGYEDIGSDFDATDLTNTVDNLRDNSKDAADAVSASAARALQLRSNVSEDTAGNTSDAAVADDSTTQDVQCDANGTLERTMSNVARAQGGVLHAFNDDHYDGTGSGSTATVPSDSTNSSSSSGGVSGININISGSSAFDRPSKGLLPPASPLTRGFSVSRQRSLDSAIDKLDDNLQLDDEDSVSAFC